MNVDKVFTTIAKDNKKGLFETNSKPKVHPTHFDKFAFQIFLS